MFKNYTNDKVGLMCGCEVYQVSGIWYYVIYVKQESHFMPQVQPATDALYQATVFTLSPGKIKHETHDSLIYYLKVLN